MNAEYFCRINYKKFMKQKCKYEILNFKPVLLVFVLSINLESVVKRLDRAAKAVLISPEKDLLTHIIFHEDVLYYTFMFQLDKH